jgi:hypothetical protein
MRHGPAPLHLRQIWPPNRESSVSATCSSVDSQIRAAQSLLAIAHYPENCGDLSGQYTAFNARFRRKDARTCVVFEPRHTFARRFV